jgi:hypothetical protein
VNSSEILATNYGNSSAVAAFQQLRDGKRDHRRVQIGDQDLQAIRLQAEYLQNNDDRSQLSNAGPFQIDNGVGSLVDDHIIFVLQARLDKLKQR